MEGKGEGEKEGVERVSGNGPPLKRGGEGGKRKGGLRREGREEGEGKGYWTPSLKKPATPLRRQTLTNANNITNFTVKSLGKSRVTALK
jgi:hypothetical protein